MVGKLDKLQFLIYTVSQKNCTNFIKIFTDRFSGKFATNAYLNIPPHLKCVATLPCEVSTGWAKKAGPQTRDDNSVIS